MSAAQMHVRRMLNRIEQSYSEPITLHWLAAELHRQEAQLGAMFRHEVGVPMRECLTRVRLDHAAALIREGLKAEAVSMLVDIEARRTSTGNSNVALAQRRSPMESRRVTVRTTRRSAPVSILCRRK
jgi:AraC-like DNA-binding protein